MKKAGDRVRASAEGLAANPELRNLVGEVEQTFDDGVYVRFGEGKAALWSYLRTEYVEACDGPAADHD